MWKSEGVTNKGQLRKCNLNTINELWAATEWIIIGICVYLTPTINRNAIILDSYNIKIISIISKYCNVLECNTQSSDFERPLCKH